MFEMSSSSLDTSNQSSRRILLTRNYPISSRTHFPMDNRKLITSDIFKSNDPGGLSLGIKQAMRSLYVAVKNQEQLN